MKPPSSHAAPCRREKERGNAFVIIMLGVVLFAALMMTFSRSTRQGGENMSQKTAALSATDILNQVQKIERGAGRIQMKNVSETDLSFDNVFASGYANANCASSSCKVYEPGGGNVLATAPDPAWLDKTRNTEAEYGAWVITGDNRVAGAGGVEIGTAAADLVVILPWVQRAICVEINRQLNVGTPGGDPPDDTNDFSFVHYTGAFSATPEELLTDALPAACVGSAAKGGYHFYYVIGVR